MTTKVANSNIFFMKPQKYSTRWPAAVLITMVSPRFLYYAKARLRWSKLSMKCQLSLSSTFYFHHFRPIWPILLWADRPVCTSLSSLREERKKYSIAKLGYASVRAESGIQRQLKWHRAGLAVWEPLSNGLPHCMWNFFYPNGKVCSFF